MQKGIVRFGFLTLLLATSFVMAGCTGSVRLGDYPQPPVVAAPPAEEVVVDVRSYYDDPVRGWYVEGYWVGGCYRCGVWVRPFWTTNIVILHRHWAYYHGHHRVYIERHFQRHGGYQRYDHRQYERHIQQHQRQVPPRKHR